ncbi:MAG TPA: SulP family inorganic anion transporter [Rhodocyclaceae bacterium]
MKPQSPALASPWRSELMPGALAALLTLPQALALAALAGMPFQAGIHLALVPALAATLIGHSPVALSGPNTAASLILASSASALATPGSAEYVQQVLATTLLAGAFQVLLAAARVGNLLLELPDSVTRGVLAGTGVLIVAQQAGPLLAVPVNGSGIVEMVAQALWFDAPNGRAAFVGVVSILAGLGAQACGNRRSSLLVALLAGWLAAELADLALGAANTGIERLGAVTIGGGFLSWPAVDAADPSHLLAAARDGFAVAVVGALQTAVTARILAMRVGGTLGINRDIAGQAAMNLLAAFTSAFAGAASFNRSLANVDAGACGRQAGIYCVAFLGLGTLLAGPLLARIPLPAVAGVLVLVGVSMIVGARGRAPRRGYLAELAATALAAVFLGLLPAVMVGALLAAYFRAVTPRLA